MIKKTSSLIAIAAAASLSTVAYAQVEQRSTTVATPAGSASVRTTTKVDPNTDRTEHRTVVDRDDETGHHHVVRHCKTHWHHGRHVRSCTTKAHHET